MKKKNFVSMVMGTVGGLIYGLGMCMCLLPEWNAFRQGVEVACTGGAILLAMVILRRKMEGKPAISFNAKALGTFALGIAGTLILGVGMCMIMVWNMMISGIVAGSAGILLLLCLVPICKGLK